MIRYALIAAAVLLPAAVAQPTIAEEVSNPAAVKLSVVQAELVDQALGRHADLPFPDEYSAAASALLLPQFPPTWLYGLPFSQQPLFANKPISTPSGSTK